ncbi:MAG: hypothetical protein, partial [Olavius algarvensis Gamma 3 endosymbiont]
ENRHPKPAQDYPRRILIIIGIGFTQPGIRTPFQRIL